MDIHVHAHIATPHPYRISMCSQMVKQYLRFIVKFCFHLATSIVNGLFGSNTMLCAGLVNCAKFYGFLSELCESKTSFIFCNVWPCPTAP